MRRAERLPGGRAFDAAYRRGTVIGGPFFVVRVAPGGGEGVRWGFAVGKRLDRRSVVRNRIRRRLREAARGVAMPPGTDIVVTARPAASAASFGDLQRAMAGAARRAEKAWRGEEQEARG